MYEYSGISFAFFEAVAMGIPVACLRISGPDMIVADDCGIKIEPTNPKEVIEGLSAGLYKLSTNPDLRRKYAKSAKLALLEKGTWSKIMSRVEGIYKEVLEPID